MASNYAEPCEEKKAKYETLIQNASKAYLDKYYQRASICYFDALTLAAELGLGKKVKTILKYMMCQCMLECNKSKNNLDELSEVVMTLQTLEKPIKDKFPATYCLLAQAHCKLYRFDQALDVINEAMEVFEKNARLETLYIPGTNIEIDQYRNNEAWLTVKEECSTWHKPDAICNLPECNFINKPYVTPNRNIFLRDPAFNGIVIVNCNNKTCPCELKFHPYCWKFMKDQLYPVKKVSDKDMLGNSCFTPSCMNGNAPCTISSIEIVGPDGELKAHIKESTSVPWLGNKNASKGAIKKVKVNSCKKPDSPTTASKQYNSVIPKQETYIRKRPTNCATYDENQIVSVTDISTDIEFTNDSEHVADTKRFLFSMFVSYIGENSNLVTVGDVYAKFSEFADFIDIDSIKNMDILTFLLETKKIEVLNKDVVQIPYVKRENVEENYTNMSDNDSTQDVDDVFYDLTNDDDDTGFSNKFIKDNNNKHYPHSMLNSHETYKVNGATNPHSMQRQFVYHDAAGGDAPSHLSDIKNTTHGSIEPEKRVNENKKLKDFIDRLQNDMQRVLKENENLKQELHEKNSVIESSKKEQGELEEKMQEVELLHNKMLNFKKDYDQVKEENIKLKEEIIELIRQKNNLEDQVSTNNNPEVKRVELLKSFQEEYQILEDCINMEWEKKTEELKKTLHSKTETLVAELLSKCINYQHTSNKHLLERYVHFCTLTVEISNNINIWMEKTLHIQNFIDTSEWLSKLKLLDTAAQNNESEYLQYVNKLKLDSTDKLAMIGTELNSPDLPDQPMTSLSAIVENTLNVLYNAQSEMTKNLVKQQQQIQMRQLQQQKQHHQQPTPPPSPLVYPMTNAPPGYAQYPAAYPYGYNSPGPALRPILPYPMPQTGILPTPPMHSMPQMSPYKELAASWKPQWHAQNTNVESHNNGTQNVTPKLEIVELNTSEIKKECQVEEVKAKEELVDYESQNELEKHINNRVDEVQERLTLIQEALRGICISAQEKRTLDNSTSDDESVTTVKSKGDKNMTAKTENSSTKSESMFKHESSTNDEVVPVTTKWKPKRKQIGTEDLLKLLLKKYPGTLELDMIEIISEIRKKHNNTLSGIPVSQIIKESEELFLQSQRNHMLRYFLNDGIIKQSSNETTAKEPAFNQQNVHKELLSPASSTSSLNRMSVPSTPKKGWNMIPQEEVKWTGNKEVECSICMGPMNKNNCYTLSCRHSFHTNCVKKWLRSDRSCPNCRVIVTEDDEFPPLPA